MGWKQFANQPLRNRFEQLNGLEQFQFFLHTQQLDLTTVQNIFSTVDFLKKARKDVRYSPCVRSLLANKSCALYFTQSSTRTFTSFSLAAQEVGMMTEEIRDKELSAEYKGESELDTLLTLATLADCVVLRQGDAQLAERFAYEIHRRGWGTRVVNGGSGSEQHPTQALLDLYTIYSQFSGIFPKGQYKGTDIQVALVGDLARSRTAKSLSYLLSLFPDIKQVFISPDSLKMDQGVKDHLNEHSIAWSESDKIDDFWDLDVVYLQRIQDEYSEGFDAGDVSYQDYHLTLEKVQEMHPKSIVLHPLPRRDELAYDIDLDPRAKYWDAVRNGRYVRSALLLHMFGAEGIVL